MTKLELVDAMNAVLKAKRNTDNYADGVLDMYNAVLKIVEADRRHGGEGQIIIETIHSYAKRIHRYYRPC